jgi:SAM-dependent methyltransferase
VTGAFTSPRKPTDCGPLDSMSNASISNEWIRLGASGAWNDRNVARSGFQREFVRLVGESAQIGGQVLDIGCGSALPKALSGLQGRFGILDGVDPDPGMVRHPLLRRGWNSCFESAEIPEASYDLAYAYNVLEHLADPRPFFRKLHQVLKPGGVCWALTPNAAHPFAVLSRLIEVIGLKGFTRRRLGVDQSSGEMMVNDYPAYYRCNSPGALSRVVSDLGFSHVTFYFHRCVQWDSYFPRFLRWLPWSYDFLVGTRIPRLMQIFIVRLEK